MNPFTTQEIQQLRAATAGTAQKIHFNNAGASLPPDIVVETIIRYLREEAQCGGYEMADKYREQLDLVYPLVARLINAQPDEIALTENASTAWGLAFNGIPFREGDEVITTELEYVTNILGFLQMQRSRGIILRIVPQDGQGRISLEALEQVITPRTRCLAITHIGSTAGNINPVAAIGRIARRHNIIYLLDACQSVGHLPVDVEEIGCDILAATGRKYLRAPRGTGFLYVRKKRQDELKLFLMDGFTAQWVGENDYRIRNDARRFELYEKNKALVLGLGKAVEYILDLGMDRIWQRIHQLAAFMRERLSVIPGVRVHDEGSALCGIVTFSKD
ncbi:MAG: aminotransferase class V-fold PLP-dependent enzyme, partial [Bacteroidetes bacterium]|nr:aminotransferase class V-fold PLP-dependent enzyme [Bacteroidota bacterium]